MIRPRPRFSLALVVPLLLLMGCRPEAGTANASNVPNGTARPAPVVVSGAGLAAVEGTLEQIYEQVNPSVVNIRIVQKQAAQNLMMTPDVPAFPGFPFPFGNDQGQEPQDQYRFGSGSGFVWDNVGHIVTNNHVVDDADRVLVTFADGSTVTAKVVGTDPDSDLAVLKVDPAGEKLRPVAVADSQRVKVGQLAVAIGNPFALQGTMTVGFVSALGRLLPLESRTLDGLNFSIADVIQTDAPINPGNSGGVLVDGTGSLIGVTTAILSPAGASAGVGFAVPSAVVTQVVPELIQSGHFTHPWIGVAGGTLNPDLAKAMQLDPKQRGGLVTQVEPGSPADKGGVRGSGRTVTIDGQETPVGGDVIVGIDDQEVKAFDDLISYLGRSVKVGQKVTLTVLRDGKEKKLSLTLEARPAGDAHERRQARGGASAPTAWMGLEGATLGPELNKAMGAEPAQQGVLIGQVEVGSPADKAGLRGGFKPYQVGGDRIMVGGDVITAVDGQPLTRMEDLLAIVGRAEPGRQLKLSILRDGKKMDVTVTLAARTDSHN